MHAERGLVAFAQNIVYARNFCNYLPPNAPIFQVNPRFNEVVTDKNYPTHILQHGPHFSETMGPSNPTLKILDTSLVQQFTMQ